MFSIRHNGGISISGARRRLSPEMTSALDGATMVFLFVFRRHLSSIFSRFDVICAFSIINNGGKMISAAGGRSRPKMTSPFILIP
jgi:hypothetical protein